MITAPVITADTSVVVPAPLDWHEHHAVARPAVAGVDRLPGHVLAESVSVLTRLPHGLSITPADATDLLLEAFPGPPLVLDGHADADLLRRLAGAGIRGGAVYDAVGGASAARPSCSPSTPVRQGPIAPSASTSAGPTEAERPYV